MIRRTWPTVRVLVTLAMLSGGAAGLSALTSSGGGAGSGDARSLPAGLYASSRPFRDVPDVSSTTLPPRPATTVSRSEPKRPRPAPGPGSAARDPWGCIRQYESGGTTDPRGSNIPGEGYYGFQQGTWQSVGGHGRPSDASYDEQTSRAQQLQRKSGWGQWSTSRRCGLR